MKLTFLGTGTSTGVPQINCNCPTCSSTDPRDKRLRASALLSLDDNTDILIDCGPDFRTQAISNNISRIDAVLLTHCHYDHIGGLDDLRPFCYTIDGGLPLYADNIVVDTLHRVMPYCFSKEHYPGVPAYNLHQITPFVPFFIGSHEVTPIPVMHFHMPILGYRIGPFAYITDCSAISPEAIHAIEGLDTLVINALRIDRHPAHMNLSEALDVIKQVKPRQAFLTHLSHHMGPQASVERLLPDGVAIAVDGLTVDF